MQHYEQMFGEDLLQVMEETLAEETARLAASRDYWRAVARQLPPDQLGRFLEYRKGVRQTYMNDAGSAEQSVRILKEIIARSRRRLATLRKWAADLQRDPERTASELDLVIEQRVPEGYVGELLPGIHVSPSRDQIRRDMLDPAWLATTSAGLETFISENQPELHLYELIANHYREIAEQHAEAIREINREEKRKRGSHHPRRPRGNDPTRKR
jgi:hypothetical protein